MGQDCEVQGLLEPIVCDGGHYCPKGGKEKIECPKGKVLVLRKILAN